MRLERVQGVNAAIAAVGGSKMMVYFAARSRAKIESVCDGLRDAYGLPEFDFDSHDTWRYGESSKDGLHINVTRTKGYRTAETWIAGCPTGVNYVLSVTAEHAPVDFADKTSALLGTDVIRYFERPEPCH